MQIANHNQKTNNNTLTSCQSKATRWSEVIRKSFADNSNYAIYGAGKFTKHLLNLLHSYNITPPRCIIDDNPPTLRLNGITVIRTDEFTPNKSEHIALGTLCMQEKMTANLQNRFGQNVNIIDLEKEARALKLSPSEQQQKDTLEQLKNKHQNERCFIICNGPSLKTDDLNRLQNEITFAANRIDLAFESTHWRPTYYSVVDEYVAQQNWDPISGIHCSTKLFPQTLHYSVPAFDDGLYFKYNLLPQYPKTPEFGKNPLDTGFYCGSTVTYVLLQFALYMGFKKAYLLGLDFNFIRPNGTSKKKHLVKSNQEINHFHPEYRQPGETWQYPNLNHQKQAFRVAKETYRKTQCGIFNASRSSKLDVFEKVNFDDIT